MNKIWQDEAWEDFEHKQSLISQGGSYIAALSLQFNSSILSGGSQ